MLSKKERISKHAFRELERPVKTFYSDHLTARIFSGTNLLKPKFSVSVSKKLEKKAILRNKMRRVAYDTIRKNNNLLSNQFFVRFIFNTKPTDLKNQIPAEIINLLKQIG